MTMTEHTTGAAAGEAERVKTLLDAQAERLQTVFDELADAEADARVGRRSAREQLAAALETGERVPYVEASERLLAIDTLLATIDHRRRLLEHSMSQHRRERIRAMSRHGAAAASTG